MQKTSYGFTLIELMVAVAIVGILSAIAWPSYMNSVRKTNRAEAKSELMDLAQRLQKCYSTYGRFNDPANTGDCPVYSSLANETYLTRGKQFYKVKIEHTTGSALSLRTTYKLTATARIAPQTADTTNGCNILTLTHTGVKEPAACW